MADSTRRIPLWIIGIVAGILIDYEAEESYYRGYHSCKTDLGSRVVIRAGRREEEATTTGRDVETLLAYFHAPSMSYLRFK
ncbi:hypothetical protein HAX54_023054, partial [Datura stramonium]|nr:hypothetical protein [Datura stramonium]